MSRTPSSFLPRLQRLKELHPKRRFSCREIAAHTGVSDVTIGRIERSALLKLRKALVVACPRVYSDFKRTPVSENEMLSYRQ